MKISVITVTYNSGAVVRDAIASVLRQTYSNIEYIIVDGNSTDNTMDIVRAFEPSFAGRLRWVSEPDRGIYDAMNKGIAMATGDVVGILNSDDFFTSDNIVELIASSFVEDTDAVYGDVHYVSPANLSRSVRYYSSRSFRPWKMRFGYMPAHPSFYVRRSIYTRYGGYSLDYHIASDYDMMLRLFCLHKIRAKYVPADFVTMRTGGVSTKSMANRLLITREDAKACRKNGMYSNVLLCSVKYFTKVFEFLRIDNK